MGKDELKIEKIKEVEKFETPSKIFKLTQNNIYSNTIRSQSKGKELVIIDDFSNSKPESLEAIKKITGKDFKFYNINYLDRKSLENVFMELEG